MLQISSDFQVVGDSPTAQITAMELKMNITRITMSILTVVFLLFVQSIHNAEAEGLDLKVSVDVVASDYLKNQIVREVLKELHSTSDVLVFDINPEYKIRIFATQRSVLAISYSITVTLHDRYVHIAMKNALMEFFEKNYPDVVYKPWTKKAKFHEIFLDNNPAYSDFLFDQGLMVGQPEDLREFCGNIVTNFDVQCVEPARKARDVLNQMFKGLKKK